MNNMNSANISFKGIHLYVQFNYIPEEPMVMYYADGSGHPGSAAEIEIQEIIYESTDVYDIYDSLNQIANIEDAIFDQYKDDDYDN